jgi:hypothetical protein
VSFMRRDRTPFGAQVWLTAAAGAVLLLAALVGTVGAVTGPTNLIDATVSPRRAVEGTSVTFAVTYRNHEGSAPGRVAVLIDGVATTMPMPGGVLDWKTGVRLSLSRALAVGVHTVGFAAADTRKFTDEINAGSVTITRMAPSPTPTPKPTATPLGSGGTSGGGGGSDGSSNGSPASTSGGTSTGSTGSASGSGATGSTPGSVGTTGDREAGDIALSPGARAEDPEVVAASRPTVGPWSVTGTLAAEALIPAAGGGSSATGALDDPNQTGGQAGSANGTSDRGAGATVGAGQAILPPAFGRPSTASLEARLFVSVVETGGVITMAMAFMFFGKRRRDGEPPAPDEVLEAAAAQALPEAANGALVPDKPAPAPVDTEMLMPRWRRPSLLEARKADPARVASTIVNLTFAHADDADAGRERRRIRYRVVRLLDSPDELLATETGFLDEGDEVQLLERSGTYWQVLCPDGRTGWLHKMVLGDTVDPTSNPADGSEDEIDSDVLQAFLTARGEPAA